MIPIELKNTSGATIGTLKLSTRAMMALEALHNKPVSEVLAGLDGEPRVGELVTVLRHMLGGGKGVSEDEALDAIDEAGGIFDVMPLFGEAVKQAFPAAEARAGDAAAPQEEPKPGNQKKPSRKK